MRNNSGLIGLLLVLLLLPSAGMAQQQPQWELTLENAQRAASQTNRLVLIQFWAPWCAVCRRMETEVFSQPSICAALAANYVPVKVNADHFPATARQYNITALPTTIIVTPQGQTLETIRGRIEAVELSGRLNQLATEYKHRTGALYAQVPVNTAPTGSIPPGQSPPTATTSSPAPMTPTSAGGNGPALGADLPSTTATQPTPAGPQLTDDRYADYFRNNQPNQVSPISQPPASQPVMSAQQPAPPPAVANQQPPMQQPQPTPPQNTGATQVTTASLSTNTPPDNTAPIAASQQPQPTSIHPPIGLDGCCPVTLSEKQQWATGDRRYGAIHRGRTYLFVGPEEQRRFFADPDRYAPVVSGNDIVLAIEQGEATPGMREHGVFYNNRVFLFASEATLERFARNPTLYANQAFSAAPINGPYAGQK